MSEEQAEKLPYNPFDITKVWYHKDFPLIEVGELVLNRNPENYFAEVEQSGFTPAHIVPGIGFSPDKFLQGRLFAYGDAQRYRLGVSYNQIPVNKPHCMVNDNSRDSFMGRMATMVAIGVTRPTTLISGILRPKLPSQLFR